MRINCLPVAVVALLVSVANSQDKVTIRSDSDSTRPIATLLKELRERERIPVTYEDPRYSSPADIQDVTAQVARHLTPADKRNGFRVLVPKGLPITFVYSREEMRTPSGIETSLARMLGEYADLGGPRFKVFKEGVRFHVVPYQVRDRNGSLVRQDSVLDMPVSLIVGRRENGGDVLHEVCEQLFKLTSVRIEIGPGGMQFHNYIVKPDMQSQSARGIFDRFWDETTAPGSYVWDLFYDPGDKSYGLNFSCVRCAGRVN